MNAANSTELDSKLYQIRILSDFSSTYNTPQFSIATLNSSSNKINIYLYWDLRNFNLNG